MSKQNTLSELKKLLKPIKDDLAALKKNAVTKDDLKNFATKDDLKNFATKDDLKNFATKDDLKPLARQKDLLKVKSDLFQVKKTVDGIDGFLKAYIPELAGWTDDIHRIVVMGEPPKRGEHLRKIPKVS